MKHNLFILYFLAVFVLHSTIYAQTTKEKTDLYQYLAACKTGSPKTDLYQYLAACKTGNAKTDLYDFLSNCKPEAQEVNLVCFLDGTAVFTTQSEVDIRKSNETSAEKVAVVWRAGKITEKGKLKVYPNCFKVPKLERLSTKNVMLTHLDNQVYNQSVWDIYDDIWQLPSGICYCIRDGMMATCYNLCSKCCDKLPGGVKAYKVAAEGGTLVFSQEANPKTALYQLLKDCKPQVPTSYLLSFTPKGKTQVKYEMYLTLPAEADIQALFAQSLQAGKYDMAVKTVPIPSKLPKNFGVPVYDPQGDLWQIVTSEGSVLDFGEAIPDSNIYGIQGSMAEAYRRAMKTALASTMSKSRHIGLLPFVTDTLK